MRPTPRKSVPVVYDPRLDPIPLTRQQLDEILDQAEPIAPRGQRVWYIHVHKSSMYEGENYWGTTVFYTPGVITDRIRKGKCVRITSHTKQWAALAEVFERYQKLSPREQEAYRRRAAWLKRVIASLTEDEREALKKLSPKRRAERLVELKKRLADTQPVQPAETPPARPAGTQPVRRDPALDDYMQVSVRGRPFGRELDTPTRTLWPFRPPEGFRDEEIIEIVDFARTSPRVAHDEGTFGMRFEGREPIHRIERSSNGTVEVWSGAQQAPLAGSGKTLRCIKTKDGTWVALAVGRWVS